MDLQLIRKEKISCGIFGDLRDESGHLICVTLEHAFHEPHDQYEAIIPIGSYNCVRGKHRLLGMTRDFDTFEITHVPGHSQILFHWGNYNKDSKGCILLGTETHRAPPPSNQKMIIKSILSFQQFMKMQGSIKYFKLQILDDSNQKRGLLSCNG